MTVHHPVKLTAHFERNLEELQAFLIAGEASHDFETLLDVLTDTVSPNLENFPGLGRLLLERPARSVEAANGMARLSGQLGVLAKEGELREYVTTHYLLLYARFTGTVYLLSIRHQRQLSFDFPAHWTA